MRARLVAAAGLALLLLAGLLPTGATSQVGASNIDIDSVPDSRDPALRLFTLINAERVAEGVPRLRWNDTLEVIAADWAVEMERAGQISHRPDLADVVTSSWRRMGENVGVSPYIDRMHQAFMDSPGHRRNVVGDYDQVGIAVVQGERRLWAVVNFGKGSITSTYVRWPSGFLETRFRDISRDGAHYEGVLALADEGISLGCTSSRYCPSGTVTRAEMAAFVARAENLSTSGRRSGFADVARGSTFDGAIDAVRDAGLMPGCSATRFCPTALVDRAEMAGIMARMGGWSTSYRSTSFVDVPSSLVGEVEAIRRAGVTTGCTSSRYCPDGSVTRAEMATFLARALDLI